MLRPTGYIKPDNGEYSKNPVMQVIGQQFFPCNTDATKECQIIINSRINELTTPGHRGNAICAVVMDAFILGMIYGKREERQNRRERRERREQATA